MRVTSQDILYGPIAPTLRRMTIPMIGGILALFAFQMVDTYFIGLLGTGELAAISFTFPVTHAVTSLTVGLGISTSVILASVLGQGNHERARRITTDSLLLTLIVVVLICGVGYISIDSLFTWLGAEPSTLPNIKAYMEIWFLGVGLLVIPQVGNSVIRATGDTRWPSFMMAFTVLINALLDPILIFGFGPVPALGIQGAAIASLCSWFIFLVASLWVLRFREQLLTFSLGSLHKTLRYWRQLSAVALPLSLANVITPVTAGVLTALAARHGEAVVAAFGAGTRIESVALVVCFALTAALSPYMAQNLGAGNYRRAREAFMLSVKFAVALQTFIYVLLALTAPWLSQMFSRDPEVLEVTTRYLWIMPLGLGFYGLLTLVNTAFNAAHQSNYTLVAGLLRLVLFMAPLSWLGSYLFGVTGLFMGATLGNIVAAGCAWMLLVKRSYQQEHMYRAGVPK